MPTRLRPLRIDGDHFVWRAETCCVRGPADGYRCVRVRVWGDGKASRSPRAGRLTLPWPACATTDIRAIVAYGLRRGWLPTARGGTFLLSERAKSPVVTFLPAERPRAERVIRPSAIET